MNFRKSFIICLLFCLLVPVSAKEKRETMYVIFDSAPVKKKSSALSEQIATLPYSTQVYVIERKKGWVCIAVAKDESIKGWVPENSLNKKKIKSKGSTTSVDAKEIALAGKGFNSTIEESYAKTKKINFKNVDIIENYSRKINIINFFLSSLIRACTPRIIK